MSMLQRFIFLVFWTSIILPGFSQDRDWGPPETIYKDADVKVDVSFSIAASSCDAGGKKHQFRYHITGLKKGGDNVYLNWKMDIVDCNRKTATLPNSVNIGPNGTEGIVLSYEYSAISAIDLNKMYYDVVLSSTPTSGAQLIGSANSKAPDKIEGNNQIKYGESTTLRVSGGYLGYNAKWVWYDGKCGGNRIGEGHSITARPKENTTYYVRAEGKDFTLCAALTVNVDMRSTAPGTISGEKEICVGGSTRLSVADGKLGPDAEWAWYADSCGGKPLANGISLHVTPSRSTWYFVRAEGKHGITTCARAFVRVNEKSSDPVAISGSGTICEGQRVTLTVSGGKLGQDASWKWYANSCGGTPIGTGTSISVTPNNTTTYYVRGEGVCNSTNCISTRLLVRSASTTPVIRNMGTVHKRKKTDLYILMGKLGEGAQWKWYKDGCGTGGVVGEGEKITIKPKSNARYFVRAEGDCNTTMCANVTILPVSQRKFTPAYGSHIYKNKTIHLGIGIGADAMYYAVSAEKRRFNNSGTVVNTSSEEINITGLGLKAEFVFHPIIKEPFSMGFITSYATGTTPRLIVGSKVLSTDANSEKERLYYSRFEIGAEIATGGKLIKFLAAYKNSMQRHQYERTAEFDNALEITKFFHDLRKETISSGLRIGAYSRYKKNSYKKGISFDLTYNISRDYDWAWNNFVWKYNNTLSNWQHGFGINMWIQSVVKVQMDVSLFRSQLREKISIDNEGNRSYYQLSLIYNRNGFF